MRIIYPVTYSHVLNSTSLLSNLSLLLFTELACVLIHLYNPLALALGPIVPLGDRNPVVALSTPLIQGTFEVTPQPVKAHLRGESLAPRPKHLECAFGPLFI